MTDPAPPGNCFRCGKPGHWASKCDELIPAADKAEHEARLDLYRERWETGQWTPQQKWAAISAENRMWHGDKCTPMQVYPRSNS